MRTATPETSPLALRQGQARGHYVLDGHAATAPPLAPGLYLVATPIGNLRDITLRALEALAAADLIACEDTRRSRKLLDHYGVRSPLSPYHDHNAATVRPKLLGRLAQGEAIALISDAGTPLVSDPGYKLVREAQERGHTVTALPGPSALLAALTVSGLPTDRFLFEGFLPAKAAQRRSRIDALKSVPATLIIFEAGARIAAALADLAAALSPREAAVCRELTKLHEEVHRGDLAVLAGNYASDPERRGEFVVVVGPPQNQPELSPTDLDALLRAALERLSVREAVAEAVAVTGAPRRLVYQRALALRGE
ncbi:MAG TPA: 16S rRNA (cytidine(1402)-2'-O)-methyltransferase [Xanthobacteraceae bacterium]|jgi:16S rRNA (cytidine1402-2'-O)-methyltransferase